MNHDEINEGNAYLINKDNLLFIFCLSLGPKFISACLNVLAAWGRAPENHNSYECVNYLLDGCESLISSNSF